MRASLLAIFVLATAAPGPGSAQNAPQDRNLCSHATSQSGAQCPSLGPNVEARMRRHEALREERKLRAEIDAALADGRCEDARRIAVDHGRHQLAARIRNACAVGPGVG